METTNSPFILNYTVDDLISENDLLRISDPDLRDKVREVIKDELFQKTLHFDFSVSSLNYELNQKALTANKLFTADLSFEASIIGQLELEDEEFSPVEFDLKLKNVFKTAKNNATGINIDVLRSVMPASLRELFENFVFRHWESTPGAIPIHDFVENLTVNYYLLKEVQTNVDVGAVFDGKLNLCVATRKSSNFSKWHVTTKFSHDPAEQETPGDPPGTPGHPPLFDPGLYYPSLSFDPGGHLSIISLEKDEEEFDFGNDEIGISHEVLILPAQSIITTITTDTDGTTTTTTSGEISPSDAINNVSDTIGKVANDISETILNIGDKIARNLTGTFRTQLQPVGSPITKDMALWVLIKKGTEDLGFDKFADYMDAIFCGGDQKDSAIRVKNATTSNGHRKIDGLNNRRHLPFPSVDAYRSVKVATEAFVMVNCMVNDGGFDQTDIADLSDKVPLTNGIPDAQALDHFWEDYLVKVRGTNDQVIPYLAIIRRKLGDEGLKTSSFEGAFQTYVENGFDTGECYGIIEDKLLSPCFLELIWSYWIEESMMVQGLKAILRRFQNIRGPGVNDPLANLLIDPLRPLSNLLWGYAQDEQHRLTVMRRGYEYNSHYGITPHGNALKNMRFADSRSKFMEAFHTLLNLTSKFYKQADDMTVKPDGFPILNALKETHLILSEGAHNQFGDLPFVARTEMLMEQWLLSRSEFREFLPTRIMVAYPEPWMDRVSAVNNLMGWTNSSVLHFRDLARFGEQILLSVRYGNWANTNSRDAASNWAQFWREQIQGYIHGYRAVTGVDLTADIKAGRRIDAQQPSVHLKRRLVEQLGNRQNGSPRKAALANVDDDI